MFGIYPIVNIARFFHYRNKAIIADEVGLKSDDIGVSLSDKLLDITSATPLHRSLILSAYVPMILASISLIAYVPIRASYHHANVWWLAISALIYMVLLLPTAMVWIKKVHPM